MPERFKWLLFGQEPSFWFAMFAVALARAGLTGESMRSLIVTVPSSVVLSLALTEAVLHYTGLPASPYGIAIGCIIILVAQPVLRVLMSLRGVADLADVVRAIRGK